MWCQPQRKDNFSAGICNGFPATWALQLPWCIFTRSFRPELPAGGSGCDVLRICLSGCWPACGQTRNMWGWQKVVLLGSCSALTSVMLLIFCPFWQAILLATIALGFGYIFIQSPLATIAFDVAPESKGLPSALIGLGLFGGGGLGTAFCGWLLQIGGYRTLWFIIMVGIAFFTLTVTRLDLDFGKKSDLKI